MLARSQLPVKDAIERLVGMQAQVPGDPYVGLWSRLEGFREDDLARLVSERRALRMGLMRGTVHLVTARDALAMWPVVRPIFDVPDGALPDPDTTAPPRFLPEYDNILLSHEDRSRIVRRDFQRSPGSGIEGTFGTVLVDGFVGAIWKISRKRGEALLRIESVRPLGRRDVDAVAMEGERLLTFTDPDASRTVSVTRATKSHAVSSRTRSARTGRAGATLETVTAKETRDASDERVHLGDVPHRRRGH